MSSSNRRRLLFASATLTGAVLAILAWTIASSGRVEALLRPRSDAFDSLAARLRSELDVSSHRRAAAESVGHDEAEESVASWVKVIDRRLTTALAFDQSWISVDLRSPRIVATMPEYLEFLEQVRAGGAPARTALVECFRSARSRRVSAVMAMAMGDLEMDECTRLLNGTLVSAFALDNRFGYGAAAFALERMQSDDALAALDAFLSARSPDWLWSQPLHEAVGSYGARGVDVLLREALRLQREGAPLRRHLVLGCVRGQDALERLTEIASGKCAEHLRAMAAHAIATIPGDQARGVLEQLLNDPGSVEVERAVIFQLGKDRAGVNRIGEWLELQDDPERLKWGVVGLQDNHSAEALDVLLGVAERGGLWLGEGGALLADESLSGLKANLARSLASFPEGPAHERLRSLFGVVTEEDRAAFVSGLASQRELDAAWGPQLRERLVQRQSLDSTAWGATVLALSRIPDGHARHVDLAVGVIETESDPAAQRRMVASLGGFDSEHLGTRLLPFLEDSGDLMTCIIGSQVIRDREFDPRWNALCESTLERTLDQLESGRISQFLLTNPDTQRVYGESLRRFLGRETHPEQRDRVEALIEMYRPLGRRSILAQTLEKSLRQLEARHALQG